MVDFNPLDYGDPVEDEIVGINALAPSTPPARPEPGGFNPLDYGDPVEDDSTDIGQMTVDDITDILKKKVSEYGRPLLEMGGSVAGAVIGAGAGVATTGGLATPLLSVAGSGLGYAIGGETADLLDQWMGLQKQKSLPRELGEAGKRFVEGAAFEAGGQGAIAAAIPAIKGVGRAASHLLPPLTPKGAATRAGEILTAHTSEGPLIAKNIDQATKLEKEIPGLKFTRGQKTGDPSTIQFERAQMREPGTFAGDELEQKAANSEALRKYIYGKQGAGGIDRALTSAQKTSESVSQRVLSAEEKLSTEVGRIDTGDVQEAGKAIKKSLTAGSKAAQTKGGKLFEELPEMEFEAAGLSKQLDDIRQPFDRYEDIGDDVIPPVLERAIKLIEADGNKISLKEAQSLSSNIKKQIRGGVQKEAGFTSRLKKAQRAVDDFIEKAEPSTVSPEKATKAEAYAGMKAEVSGSETRGYNYDQEGDRVYFSASSPQWMRNMQQAVKKAGGDQFSRKEINTLIDKVSAGKPLTEKQAGRFKYIDDASQEFKNTDQSQIGAGAADDMIADGYEPMGGIKKSVGDFKEGDEFTGKIGTVEGDFKVEGVNDGGAIIVDKFGTDFELSVFDEVTVDGIKTGKDVSYLSSKAQAASEKVTLKEAQKKAAADLKKARGVWKTEYIEKFKQGEVKSILSKGKDGADKVQSAQIASKFFRPGKAGADAADYLLKAVGKDPKARQAILDYATQDLIHSATNPATGELTEAGLRRWMHKHRIALDKYGITGKFTSLKNARGELTKATEFKKEFEKSATAKLLGTDPEKAIGKALSGPSQRAAVENMLKSMRGDKAAVAGLQNSLIDHILTASETTATDAFGEKIIGLAGLDKNIKKYASAMRVLYKGSPEKLKALNDVRGALRIMHRNTRSPVGGGSDTAENIITHLAKKSFMGVGKVAAVVKAAMSPIKNYSDQQINMIINRALLDPNFSTTLIMASKGIKPDLVKQRMIGHMAALGIMQSTPRIKSIDRRNQRK